MRADAFAGLIETSFLDRQGPVEVPVVLTKPTIDDDNLVAMGTYVRLLAEFDPQPIETPALLVRASEQLGATMSRSSERPTRAVTSASRRRCQSFMRDSGALAFAPGPAAR